jgi:hypothetical protein
MTQVEIVEAILKNLLQTLRIAVSNDLHAIERRLTALERAAALQRDSPRHRQHHAEASER